MKPIVKQKEDSGEAHSKRNEFLEEMIGQKEEEEEEEEEDTQGEEADNNKANNDDSKSV